MVTRVNGFSGMDIDSMVKSMMTAKRVPLDKLYQQKQVLNWTRDNYREVSSKLYDFRSNKLITKYGYNEALNSNKAVTTGNTDAVKATALANASGIDMEVSVTSLATKTSVKTAGAGSGFTTSSTLAQLQAPLDPSGPTSDPTSADAKAKEFKITVNGQEFKFTGATGISTVISTINSNTAANATATFDEITGQFTIASKDSGADPTSTDAIPVGLGKLVLGTDNSLLNVFNKKDQTADLWKKTEGTNAVIKINGVDMTPTSNSFTVNGVQLTLVSPTNTSGSDVKTKVTIQADTDKTLETVKGFIADYNALLSSLNSKVDEEKYRDYAPLTDEQKAEMKEADIETWTEKAKSGLLKNDSILNSVIASMRSVISEKLGDLSKIGITTGSYYEGGKLILNETKLKQAITDNPQQIVDLLQGPTSAPATGLFDKLADKANDAISKISDKAGTNKFSADLTSTFKEESVMGKKLKEYNTRISAMLTMLNNAETRYYNQFTAMETAMNKLTTQSSSLFSS